MQANLANPSFFRTVLRHQYHYQLVVLELLGQEKTLEQMGLQEHRHMEMQMELRLNHMVSYSCYQHLERLLEHSCPGQ